MSDSQNDFTIADIISALDDISHKLDSSGHTADADVLLSVVEELLEETKPSEE